ncbi:N-acetylneuraminate synthase [bacterium SCSIO 12643]|nr:N-acetylneuraminate synthase [bacterium SCSIO 12643]
MNFNRQIFVQNTEISDTSRAFIIAEAGVNHNGDMSIAKQLIDVAVEAGVDAVKFQMFKTENLILEEVEKAPYQKNTTDAQESQFDMLKKLEVTNSQNQELIDYCNEKNIIFLSTPFDEESIEDLVQLNLPAYKIASTDTTNLPFLRKIAQTGKPLFLSTGMSYMAEVEMALSEIYKYNKQVVLLQCTANYPIEDSEANLSVIKTYQDNFDVLVGYSDHSVGLGASVYAIPMGAKVVEKHFTLSTEDEGPDHLASLNPQQLKEYVLAIRQAEKYMGTPIKVPSFAEQKTRSSLQKCLVAKEDIREGELFTLDNIIAKRTGGKGISPIYYSNFIGQRASKSYRKNEILNE